MNTSAAKTSSFPRSRLTYTALMDGHFVGAVCGDAAADTASVDEQVGRSVSASTAETSP